MIIFKNPNRVFGSKNRAYNFFYQKIAEFLLIALATLIVGFIANKYCHYFNQFGLSAKQRLTDHPFYSFIITPFLFWVSAYLCRTLAQDAAGNSLEKIKLALLQLRDCPEHPGKIASFLGLRVGFVNVCSSLLCVLGNGGLGREGTSVHISASIFSAISRRVKKFLPHIAVENWIFYGSAIGLAAAFNAPIAGMAYVTEKIIKTKYYAFKSNIIWTAISLLIFYVFFHNSYPKLDRINFDFSFSEHILLIGSTSIICGFIALSFKQTNRHFQKKFIAIKSGAWHFIPITCGILVAVLSSQNEIYFFNGIIDTTKDILDEPPILVSYQELLGQIFKTSITFISGCAGGIVAPAIAIGSGIGSVMSTLFVDVDSKILVLSSMAAFLAIIIGEPFAAALVVFEITNQPISNLPFLFFSTIIAVAAAKIIKKEL